MSFIILTIISSIVGGLLLRIGKGWLIPVPTFFIIIYALDRINQFSFKKITPRITIENGIILSWIIVMIGLMMLGESQEITRYYSGGFLVVLNTLLLVISYHTQYQEGKSIFFRGLPLAWVITIITGIWKHNIDLDSIMILGTIGTIQALLLRHTIGRIFDIKKDDILHLNQSKEITSYLLVYILCYWIFGGNSISTIVLQLRCTTVFISLRQQFLSYQSHIQHEKQVGLTGRALLQGQKVLKRYESQKNSEYSIMNTAISRGIVPSQTGLRFLQISQALLVILLIASSIWGLWHHVISSLLRYWLGVACFIINIFILDRQDKFFEWYKKLALIILSSAFYLTLFYNTEINSTFVISSLGWNCLNMLFCLFYDTIIPFHKRILNRHDLIFWMLWTNGTSIITLLSLGGLKLPGDVIFALGCIIIGMVSFFSYHIRRKYHTPLHQ